MITAGTRLVGVLGYPVEHSLSPAMQNAAFAHLGLDWAYVPLPVAPDCLGDAVRGLRALGFAGANVTLPHKERALAFLDDLAPEARALGAVNTVVNQGGRLVGHNTDAAGFLAALAEVGCVPRHAVVLGAGGAARAVVYALVQAGAAVTVANRTPERAAALLAAVAAAGGRELSRASAVPAMPASHSAVGVCALDAPDLERALARADLLVNTTPVGMWPEVDESPLPSGVVLLSGLTVFDLIYNPLETTLLRQARACGARSVGGLGMLVHQGALAFGLWTGLAAPVEVMRQAALEGLNVRREA